MYQKLILATLLLISVSCALNKKVEFAPGKIPTAENEKGGITVKADWIKNKEKSIDYQFELSNGYAENALIKESSYVLEFDGKKYPVHQGTGDLEMRAGLTYQQVLVFNLPANQVRHGKVKVTIEPITKGSKTVKPIVLNFDI